MVNFQHKEAYGYEDLLEIMAILRELRVISGWICAR